MLHNIRGRLNRQQLMVKLVFGPGDFTIRQVLAEDLADDAAGVAHVLIVLRVAKEVVAKYAAVTVWTENGIVLLQVRNLHAKIVHHVLLIVQVTKRFVQEATREVAKHTLEEQESKEVRVLP